MKLDALNRTQCEQVRLWRNEIPETLRTPFLLTKEMQEDFYENVCKRESSDRYWAIIRTIDDEIKEVVPETGFIGMGGIENIQWENRLGEISLIIDPTQTGNGLGKEAVDLLLDQAFNYLNLQTVWGECYCCNPAWEFWQKITERYKGRYYTGDNPPTRWTHLPNRKFWKGEYYDSLYFSIDRDDFNKK